MNISISTSAPTSKYAIEKEDASGVLRRYLYGITTGLEVDHDEEFMTENCVSDMEKQVATESILLWGGKHGQNMVDDLGIAVGSRRDANGELEVEYRLYDEHDGFLPGAECLAKADKLWKQANGIHPYPAPINYGFSIEGRIPENGIKSISAKGKRIVEKIKLRGVVVTPDPSYKTSVAHSVAKALEDVSVETRLTDIEPLSDQLSDKLRMEEIRDSYYQRRYRIDEIFDDSVAKLMQAEDVTQRGEILRMRIQEYGEMLFDLIIKNEAYFREQIKEIGKTEVEDKEWVANMNKRWKNIFDVIGGRA